LLKKGFYNGKSLKNCSFL